MSLTVTRTHATCVYLVIERRFVLLIVFPIARKKSSSRWNSPTLLTYCHCSLAVVGCQYIQSGA